MKTKIFLTYLCCFYYIARLLLLTQLSENAFLFDSVIQDETAREESSLWATAFGTAGVLAGVVFGLLHHSLLCGWLLSILFLLIQVHCCYCCKSLYVTFSVYYCLHCCSWSHFVVSLLFCGSLLVVFRAQLTKKKEMKKPFILL